MVDFTEMKSQAYDVMSSQPYISVPGDVKGGRGESWTSPVFWSLFTASTLQSLTVVCNPILKSWAGHMWILPSLVLDRKQRRLWNNAMKCLCFMESWSFQLKVFILTVRPPPDKELTLEMNQNLKQASSQQRKAPAKPRLHHWFKVPVRKMDCGVFFGGGRKYIQPALPK